MGMLLFKRLYLEKKITFKFIQENNMSNYDIFAIEPRQRGGERNWYPVPHGAAPLPLTLKVLPLPKTYVTNLSDVFHDEFMDRISPYLIPGDKLVFTGNANSHTLSSFKRYAAGKVSSCGITFIKNVMVPKRTSEIG
jgi:hypothetical protein